MIKVYYSHTPFWRAEVLRVSLYIGNIPFENGKTVRDNIVPIPKYTHELQNKNGRQVSGGTDFLDPKNFNSRMDYYKLWNKLINMFLFSSHIFHAGVLHHTYLTLLPQPARKSTRDSRSYTVGH